MGFLDKYGSLILGVTRIVVGLLFLEHGTAKAAAFSRRADVCQRFVAADAPGLGRH